MRREVAYLHPVCSAHPRCTLTRLIALRSNCGCFSAQVSEKALAVFEFGQREAAKRGLLLVDTKYEFGKDAQGNILLVDEIHTPDSSRYALIILQPPA